MKKSTVVSSYPNFPGSSGFILIGIPKLIRMGPWPILISSLLPVTHPEIGLI